MPTFPSPHLPFPSLPHEHTHTRTRHTTTHLRGTVCPHFPPEKPAVGLEIEPILQMRDGLGVCVHGDMGEALDYPVGVARVVLVVVGERDTLDVAIPNECLCVCGWVGGCVGVWVGGWVVGRHREREVLSLQ